MRRRNQQKSAFPYKDAKRRTMPRKLRRDSSMKNTADAAFRGRPRNGGGDHGKRDGTSRSLSEFSPRKILREKESIKLKANKRHKSRLSPSTSPSVSGIGKQSSPVNVADPEAFALEKELAAELVWVPSLMNFKFFDTA